MTDHPQTESETAMSTDTTHRQDEEVSGSGTVALTRDALPCADCGQVVAEPDPTTLVKAERVRRGRAVVVMLATCSACAERDQAALGLAEQYLSAGVAVGDRRYGGKDAARLLVEAWVALDAAGVAPSSHGVGGLQPGAALASLVVNLGSQAGGLRWRDRLNAPASLVAEPVHLVEPGTANETAWGHLAEADRDRLRDGMVQVLAERVARQAPPVALTPPELQPGEVGAASCQGVHVTDGCLYCGLHSITMSALAVLRHGGHSQAARKVWSLRRVTSSTVGGRGGSMLVGWLCPACTRAADDVGSASSPRSLEWALVDHLGLSRHPFGGEGLAVRGLRAWGALVADAQHRGRAFPAPNQAPWGHLPEEEQDGLAQDWRRGGCGA